jgi:hypothetical protein
MGSGCRCETVEGDRARTGPTGAMGAEIHLFETSIVSLPTRMTWRLSVGQAMQSGGDFATVATTVIAVT